MVYHITLKGDDDPATAFAQDDRQKATNVKDDAFDLHVGALRQPKAVENADARGEEFLKSSYSSTRHRQGQGRRGGGGQRRHRPAAKRDASRSGCMNT